MLMHAVIGNSKGALEMADANKPVGGSREVGGALVASSNHTYTVVPEGSTLSTTTGKYNTDVWLHV